MLATECYKCLGTGHFKMFAHIEGGRCFQCQGTGKSAYRPKGLAPAAAVPARFQSVDLRERILSGDLFAMPFAELHACKGLAAADNTLWATWNQRGGERAFEQAAR